MKCGLGRLHFWMMMEVPQCSAVDDSISGPISHISPFGFIIFFSLLNSHFEGILYFWTNPNIKYIKLVKCVPLCPHIYIYIYKYNIRMFIFAAFVVVFFPCSDCVVCRQRQLQLCFSASSCCPVGPNERSVAAGYNYVPDLMRRPQWFGVWK